MQGTVTPSNQLTSSNSMTMLSASGNGSKKPGKRRGCRCGLATPNPGKLTCCGQRCPCYVDGKGCFDCKCRGCRNPHKANTNSGIPVIPAVKPSSTSTSSSNTAAKVTSPAVTTALVTSSQVPQVSTTNLPTTSTTLTTNAALVNTLQSNGVSCQLVTVGQQQQPQTQVHRKLSNVMTKSAPAASAALATTTITLTAANNNLFLSPGICLINAPAAASTASNAPASAASVCHSDASLTLPLMTEDFTVSPNHPEDPSKIPFSMIMDDGNCWSKK